jgi:thiamine transport system substrate-binding protein
MIDREKLASLKIPEPKGLRDLLKPEYRRKLVLSDPRTSTAGTGFLLLTRVVLGAEAATYWKSLRSQWLTLTPGWSEAYHLFTKGEAPIVWSYVTSQAYHRANGDSKDRYVSVIPAEGTITQEEGLVRLEAHVREEKTRNCLGKFEEFLKSASVQREIPKTNWMFPSFLPEAEWPAEFKGLLPNGFRARDVEWKDLGIQAALEEWATWVQ